MPDILWWIVMIGAAIGGLAVLGYLIIWILGYVDWMNRGSH